MRIPNYLSYSVTHIIIANLLFRQIFSFFFTFFTTHSGHKITYCFHLYFCRNWRSFSRKKVKKISCQILTGWFAIHSVTMMRRQTDVIEKYGAFHSSEVRGLCLMKYYYILGREEENTSMYLGFFISINFRHGNLC